jgi:hypothetical protein
MTVGGARVHCQLVGFFRLAMVATKRYDEPRRPPLSTFGGFGSYYGMLMLSRLRASSTATERSLRTWIHLHSDSFRLGVEKVTAPELKLRT